MASVSSRKAASILQSVAVAALVAVIGAWSVLGSGSESAHAQVMFDQPRQSPKAALGRALFFDASLSHPVGQACSSCHAPQTGFTFPNSAVNLVFGVANGAIPTRFGFRAVPTISYAAFMPDGPPHGLPRPFQGGSRMGGGDRAEAVFVGGFFWDGHATDLVDQAEHPFRDANEMNDLVHNLPSMSLVAAKVAASPEANQFKAVYGANVFSGPASVVFENVADAISEYERSHEVSPFSSKYDRYLAGQAVLTPAELDGLRLATGSWSGRPGGKPYYKSAQCVACHSIPNNPKVGGPDLWTLACYANLGVPKNAGNPFYFQTNAHTNPAGYNPLGRDFIDLGLGGYLYPLNDLPSGNMGPGSNGLGDFLAINGAFKAPTLRNVDKRPHPAFVKAYMHNGSLKTLKQVVHFYNTRNLTTHPGEVIDFTQEHPYAHLRGRPLWPQPEVSSAESLENPTGAFNSDTALLGNLGLTSDEEDHIVAFLKTLTDGQ